MVGALNATRPQTASFKTHCASPPNQQPPHPSLSLSPSVCVCVCVCVCLCWPVAFAFCFVFGFWQPSTRQNTKWHPNEPTCTWLFRSYYVSWDCENAQEQEAPVFASGASRPPARANPAHAHMALFATIRYSNTVVRPSMGRTSEKRRNLPRWIFWFCWEWAF